MISDTDDLPPSNPNKCTVRLHSSLEKLRKRQAHLKSSALIDLSGYALHQTLKNAPLDMYVTDIKVRTPGIGDWVRVQKCQFSNRDNRVTTQILFNDLTVSGAVKLFDENVVLKNPVRPEPSEFCSMTLRLRRAGLGINAFPTRERSKGIEVRTEARFVDPNFLSVHAYGCKLTELFKNPENFNKKWPNDNEEQISRKSLTASDRYTESDIESRQMKYLSNPTNDDYIPISTSKNISRTIQPKSEPNPEVRIISLGPNLPSKDDSIKNYDFFQDGDENINEYHKVRILRTKFNPAVEKEKLKAVLHMKNLIAQQANQVFQTHGPFSQYQKPPVLPTSPPLPYPPNKNDFQRPLGPGPKPIGSITELDENLNPIRPIPHRPYEALFSHIDDKIVNYHQQFQPNVEDVSREMEDVFLRGVKTLLTKYLEKQLEIPLKEALMVNIGYTVSYG